MDPHAKAAGWPIRRNSGTRAAGDSGTAAVEESK